MFNNLQIWVFVIVFAFSGISWVVRKLQEQAAIKAAKDRELRRRDEFLRTGRDPGAGQAESSASLDDAQARLRELAQRRQAQLRDLRKRAQAGGEEQPERREVAEAPARPPVAEPNRPQSPTAGPVTAELWPGGPVVVIKPAQPAPVQAAPAPAPRPVARTAAAGGKQRPPERWSSPAGGPDAGKAERDVVAKRAARAAANRRAEQVRLAAEKQEAKEAAIAKAQAARLVQGAAARETSERLAAAKLEHAHDVWSPPRTAERWREAFIASEVLGPPVAGRSQHLSGFGG